MQNLEQIRLTSGALVCNVSVKTMSLFIILVSLVDRLVGELMMTGRMPTLLNRRLPLRCDGTPSGS